MTDFLVILKQAVNAVCQSETEKPSSQSVVDSLIKAEKIGRNSKKTVEFSQLVGNWRLCFITGTKKARQRGGIVLGAGRYLPRWLKIELTYTRNALDNASEGDYQRGDIENRVQLGGLVIGLSGLVKFFPRKQILAFDFTQMTVKLGNFTVYSGNIRGGKSAEQEFYSEPLKKQAFFAYFLVTDEMIAARGKGGGLALWGKSLN